MRRAALALACALGLAGPAGADALQVLRAFADALYVVGESDGGDPETWARLEAQALDELRDEVGSLTRRNAYGRTPLMVAAANGYGFAVEWMLTQETVRKSLEQRDEDGLSAYDLAQMAMRQTAQACAPRNEDPFVLVPLLVAMPYYVNRQPYPAILTALAARGADTSDGRLRAHWLQRCPDAEPALRRRIADDAPVQRSLFEGARDVMLAKCSAEARLRHRSIERMFAGRPDAAGVVAQSRDQADRAIENCIRDLSGFVPR